MKAKKSQWQFSLDIYQTDCDQTWVQYWTVMTCSTRNKETPEGKKHGKLTQNRKNHTKHHQTIKTIRNQLSWLLASKTSHKISIMKYAEMQPHQHGEDQLLAMCQLLRWQPARLASSCMAIFTLVNITSAVFGICGSYFNQTVPSTFFN